MVLAIAVETHGHSVLDMADGDDPLERVGRFPFDLCIMDVTFGVSYPDEGP
jgi:CheY-like chemotaxis protein